MRGTALRLYRAKCLTALGTPLRDELAWLNGVSLKHIKNYQIWHHRQFVITRLGDVEGEAEFIAQMLERDSKNYHVWSYRQWLVSHFRLWDDAQEMEDVERYLRRDVRNNSAWNHRWFLVFGRFAEPVVKEAEEGRETEGEVERVSEEVWEREVEFAKGAIRLAPQNESAWNYLRAVVRKRGLPVSELKSFAEEFAGVGEEGMVEDDKSEAKTQPVRSSHALDVLADAYAEEERAGKGSRGKAEKALQLLAQKYDPVRVKYWDWRMSLLSAGAATA